MCQNLLSHDPLDHTVCHAVGRAWPGSLSWGGSPSLAAPEGPRDMKFFIGTVTHSRGRSTAEMQVSVGTCVRAGEGIRTLDVSLGKAAFYH